MLGSNGSFVLKPDEWAVRCFWQKTTHSGRKFIGQPAADSPEGYYRFHHKMAILSCISGPAKGRFVP